MLVARPTAVETPTRLRRAAAAPQNPSRLFFLFYFFDGMELRLQG